MAPPTSKADGQAQAEHQQDVGSDRGKEADDARLERFAHRRSAAVAQQREQRQIADDLGEQDGNEQPPPAGVELVHARLGGLGIGEHALLQAADGERQREARQQKEDTRDDKQHFAIGGDHRHCLAPGFAHVEFHVSLPQSTNTP
jgi:hypothetical protein